MSHYINYALCSMNSVLLPLRAGVVTAEDGTLRLPALATQQDVIQCLATISCTKAVGKSAKCQASERTIKLWDLHNVIGSMGGYKKVRIFYYVHFKGYDLL